MRRLGGMAQIGGTWFVGCGWTPEKIERTLAALPKVRKYVRDEKRRRS